MSLFPVSEFDVLNSCRTAVSDQLRRSGRTCQLIGAETIRSAFSRNDFRKITLSNRSGAHWPAAANLRGAIGCRQGGSGGQPLCHDRRDPVFGTTVTVDFVEPKTCSFDCGCCPHGTTSQKTIDRLSGPDAEPILHQLIRHIDKAEKPDCVLVAGKGDPLLYRGVGTLIGRIRKITGTPVAVATSGALLWRKDVQNELLAADTVLAVFDAPDKSCYHRLNHPHEVIPFERYLGGLAQFSSLCRGNFWLRTTFVDGYNTSGSDVTRLAGQIATIGCRQIFIGTAANGRNELIAADRFAAAVRSMGNGAAACLLPAPGSGNGALPASSGIRERNGAKGGSENYF